MRFIGDVHGKYRQYLKIINECRDSIQVGDLGVGFRRLLHPSFISADGVQLYEDRSQWHPNPPHYAMKRGNHRFIRGNHDNPSVCRQHSQWIRDGHIEGNMMLIGGAVSVDKEWRHEGYDWWADEELATEELYNLVDKYLIEKPDIMVTHDCPEDLAAVMCAVSQRRKIDIPSRTRQAFQSMLSGWQPRIWIFGHWHYPFDQVIAGTRFICLGELQYIDIDV